ncbi:MAG TPA: MFS transporter [Verrucomicrobiales bacterium]|nr:MFS transporter [Verrucomicrobiales bacterium]
MSSLFIWFRLLFNCRFYYPVFTILFLDLGLSIAEFAALNVVWAVTIVLLEVPSGALADRFGRRPLIVAAGWLMVAEMAVLCLMPVGDHGTVLWLFVLNRILSGAAEACASGADEALAYDSLPEQDRAALWPAVLARLSRAMALGFIVSSVTGAVMYDHAKVNALLAWLGMDAMPRPLTLKLPLLMNLLTGVACLLVALRMREPAAHDTRPRLPWTAETARALRGMFGTGLWIWRRHGVFRLLVLAVVFDSVIRLFLTVASQYYRLIGIGEAWYGVIGTTAALLGLASAGMMEKMTLRSTLRGNFAFLALLTLGGLACAAAAAPGWPGVALVMPVMLAMRFLQFFLSHYLNAETGSDRRATVLSFRGLATNLAYGGMTLIFGWHTGWLKSAREPPADDLIVFADSLKIWPAWFAATLLLSLLLITWHSRR